MIPRLSDVNAARIFLGSVSRHAKILVTRNAPNPKVRAASDPVGPQNDVVILDSLAWADRVIAAWGTHGAHLQRGPQMEALLRYADAPLWHLGLTKDGHPKHPLYIGYAVQPVVWNVAN
jgi:hypothetical protein